MGHAEAARSQKLGTQLKNSEGELQGLKPLKQTHGLCRG